CAIGDSSGLFAYW
nr:immunoglobulin heavy chain junction region [Mus musculus]